MFDAARALLREDQLVVVEVKVTQRMGDDGEVQGLRIVAEQRATTSRRCASAGRKRLKLVVQRQRVGASTLADILAPFRADGAAGRRRTTQRRASAATSSCPTPGASA